MIWRVRLKLAVCCAQRSVNIGLGLDQNDVILAQKKQKMKQMHGLSHYLDI